MRIEDLPVIVAGSDLHVEVVYSKNVDVPFLRWIRVPVKTQGYLTPNMAGGTPTKLFSYGQRAPGGGYSHPYYIPLEDVKHIRRIKGSDLDSIS